MFKEAAMVRKLSGGILALALLAGAAGTSSAQETATPIFRAPYRAFVHHELALSLSDPGEGVGAAIEGSYRYGSGPYDFGVRGGIADFNEPHLARVARSRRHHDALPPATAGTMITSSPDLSGV
jgi:hypothetical protein